MNVNVRLRVSAGPCIGLVWNRVKLYILHCLSPFINRQVKHADSWRRYLLVIVSSGLLHQCL